MNSLAPQFSLYIYTFIALLVSWEAFFLLSKFNKINPCLIRFKENVGIIMSYIIVAFFGAALASGYWWGIQKVFTNQETALKESPVKQRVERKTEIINQLNQFVRNGNALLLQINNAHSSQFPSKFPPKENMKPSSMEKEITEWNSAVYNYLKDSVPAWAEYYHKLSTHDFPSINFSKTVIMTPQKKNRISMKVLIEGYIERILEIIRHVDSSDN